MLHRIMDLTIRIELNPSLPIINQACGELQGELTAPCFVELAPFQAGSQDKTFCLGHCSL
jgi:hypothetical protein